MANSTGTTPPPAAIPPDDLNNQFTLANPDDPKMRHVSVAGGTYTILVTGAQTNGRYCLIDMLVPCGGGPPPHRHDFEEMFTILEGEIELTFRGEARRAAAGSTVNIPANAPHFFRTCRTDRRACSACAPRPGRRSFSCRSAIPSTAVLRRRRCSAKMNRPSACGAQRHSPPNIEPSCWCEGLCSAGASLGRANAEFVKLNAPVLLRSAPKLVPLARRSAQH